MTDDELKKRNLKDLRSTTAASFKRRFCNKSAQARAAFNVDVRSNLSERNEDGTPKVKATAKDKARLREQWYDRNPNPGKFHKGEGPNTGGAVLQSSANRKHLITTL